MKNKILGALLLLVTQVLGQLYLYTSYFSESTDLKPTNMISLQTKFL